MVKSFFHKLVCVCAFFCLLELGSLWYHGSTRSLRKHKEVLPCLIDDASTNVYSKLLTSSGDYANGTSTPHAVSSKPQTMVIEEKVERCMKMANLNSESLLSKAKDNARYFLQEYRKVIPENGLKGYRSHCWKANYITQWESLSILYWEFPKSVSGNIGAFHFSTKLAPVYPYSNIVHELSDRHYESCLLCLPNVFLLGYEKCGSTFLFTFIDHLISLSTKSSNKRQLSKEPQYWVQFEAYEHSKKNVPKAESLGKYLLNYIPGIDTIYKENKVDLLLIDGTPNYMVEWPVFTETEDVMSNYCLLPAALPMLFPNSKYIAIMRNPIDMLYSNFWFSCTKKHIQFLDRTKAPDIFHNLVTAKIQTFNNCVRNTSVPSISSPCVLDDSYSACITQRLHLLDQCSDDVIANKYSPELPRCGETTLYYGIFYIHIRKWLSLVGRENLLLLTLEELDQYPSKVANDTLQFLELNRLSSTEIDIFVKKIMESGRKNSQSTVNYKSDPELQMRPDTKLALETFYHPFNLLLAELLDNNKYIWF